MKKIIFFSFIFLTLIVKVNAQNTIPIPEKKISEQSTVSEKKFKVFKVTGVQVQLDSSAQQSNGSTHYYFKATISSIGGGIVSYQWVRSDPVNPVLHHAIPGTLTLSGTGTDVILITQGAVVVGGNHIFLEILTPNSITSTKLSY